MNVQSTRRARRDAERSRRSGRGAVAGGLAILLLGGAGLGFVVHDATERSTVSMIPADCSSTQRVPVVTDTTMAEVLERKPVDPHSCIVLETAPPERPTDDETEPQQDMTAGLWVPSSKEFFPGTTETGRFTVHTDSLATSSPVVVAPEGTRDLTTWTNIMADTSVLLGDPLHDSAAHAVLRSAVAEAQNHTVSGHQLSRAVTSRTVPDASGLASLSDTERLEHAVDQGRRVVVTEQSFLDFVSTDPRGGQVRAMVPASGAWLLDYPLLVPTDAARKNSTIARAAEEIVSYLGSERGRTALAQYRLRDAAGHRPPDARSAVVPRRLTVRDESQWRRLLTSYQDGAVNTPRIKADATETPGHAAGSP